MSARLRWPGAALLVVLALGALAAGHWLGAPRTTALAQGPLLDHKLRSALASTAATEGPAATRAAGSMNDAVAALEARLARGGGTDGDWDLLAKSYEFLNRPQDAASARAHHLPAAVPSSAAAGAGSVAPAAAAPAALGAPAPVKAPLLSTESRQRLAAAERARRAKRFAEAAAIYERLAAADQLDADGWADYADTRATLDGRKLSGAPQRLIEHALALNPDHPKALWLQASAFEEEQRLADAIAVWKHLAAVLDPASADARIVAANRARDEALLGSAANNPMASGSRPPAGALAAAAPAGAAGRTVVGEITLAPGFKERLEGGATLFIVAKSVDSPGPPVAVIRRPAGQWPVAFTLDDSQAMLPGRNLSSAGRVEVEARISKSGQAMPTSGDLRGKSPIIAPGERGSVRITIDDVVS